MSIQTEFLAVLARQYDASCESHIESNDGWIQRTYVFPRTPDNVREDFLYAFNASNLFNTFSVEISDYSPRLYLEFKAE